MSDPSTVRRAGLVIPLFSCASSESWGIGEIADVPRLARWMTQACAQVLQLLPINEMAPGQVSPYSPISARAIDPIFISVADVPDHAALGGDASLTPAEREALDRVRRTDRGDHAAGRAL